jgi:hypothetical protein
MAHYTSINMWDWKFEDFVMLPSPNVIDATVYQMPGGKWRMWYKDDTNAAIMLTESDDLYTWTSTKRSVLNERKQEGPKVFSFGDYFWMLTDEWNGMRVYRSKEADTWERQGLILDKRSKRKEDGPSGAHGDVVVVGDKAYVFYFTHPERESHLKGYPGEDGQIPYQLRRSSAQVAELLIKDGLLIADQSDGFNFYLPNMKEDY